MRRRFAPWNDTAAQPLIRFEGVAKRFGSVTAVDGVDLAIYPRELFCLLGPSGCGKTTLMRILAGFERPDRGRIWLGGEDITDVPPHRRPVNMMFQSYALFPHMSVAANIGFGLKQDGASRAQIADRVAQMLTLVQLEGLGDRRPHQLSGGQRQRVALARALARKPQVLLLDEPLAALDRKLREETQFELMDIQMELGTTFLVVTHDQDEAMTMADRIGVMDCGRLAQVGPPPQVYEAPATRWVASFIGDVTLFDGVVFAVEPGGVWVRSEMAGGVLRVATDRSVSVGASVTVAVRPEKFSIRPAAGGSIGGENLLIGEVWDIGYLGDWTTYRVKLPSGLVVRAARANASRHVDHPIGWDDAVALHVAPEGAVLLPGPA